MQLKFICPYWGQEGTKASLFLARVVEESYDGVEINFPEDDSFIQSFQSCLNNIRSVKPDFAFVAQQVLTPASETADEYCVRMIARLEFLVSLKPDFINSHTGKDYYSFDDNCRIIEAAENIAQRSGIPVLHEIHRGRFTFHTTTVLPYLERFPHLKLTGDFSHWCTVSESLLSDQADIMHQIIPHVQHIHARIGYEHSPQVNDPFAPEWQKHVDIFINWWKEIIAVRVNDGDSSITITPEFGPVPYMPTLPYSQRAISDQWKINTQLKEMLRRKLQVKSVATVL